MYVCMYVYIYMYIYTLYIIFPLPSPSFQDEVVIAAHQQTMLELGLASEPKQCRL